MYMNYHYYIIVLLRPNTDYTRITCHHHTATLHPPHITCELVLYFHVTDEKTKILKKGSVSSTGPSVVWL